MLSVAEQAMLITLVTELELRMEGWTRQEMPYRVAEIMDSLHDLIRLIEEDD